ncbi:MAG: glycoside hydrolase family 18 protein [Microthrixaceae bacterium]
MTLRLLAALVAILMLGAATACSSDSQPESQSQPESTESEFADGDSSAETVERAVPAEVPAGERVVGFYTPPLRGKDAPEQELEVLDLLPPEVLDKVTHLISYVNVVDGECTPDERQSQILDDLSTYKDDRPDLRVILSLAIGLPTETNKWVETTSTPENRAEVVSSCVALVERLGFDGVDVDWEFPSDKEQADNHLSFMTELRAALDEYRADTELTVDVPGVWIPGQPPNYRWDELIDLLSWFNVMTYDLGLLSGVTALNAPLHSPEGATDLISQGSTYELSQALYNDLGVPPDMYVMGVPFYGYRFLRAEPANNGLFQPYAKDLPEDVGESEQIRYAEIADKYLDTYERHWNEGGQSPWLWDPATQTVIAYDDAESITAKVDWMQEEGLGGVMMWHLNTQDPEATLFKALAKAMDT